MDKKLIIIIVVCVAVLAGGGYFWMQEKKTADEAREAVVKQHALLQEKAKQLEEKVALLEKEISEQEADIDEEKLAEVFGEEDADEEAETVAPESVETKVMNFFRYLDGKGYAAKRGLTDDSYTCFLKMLETVKQAQPVITGETKDLFTLLKNITYFFRVLGKDMLLLIKDVLIGEDAIIEPTMSLLFEWISPWSGIDVPDRPVVSADVLYTYSSFFLHTIAGQSYMMRRDSKLRHLTSYYALVILDRANREEINRYGIDIRPHIDSLIKDMQSHKLLSNRIEYLSNLHTMRKKY